MGPVHEPSPLRGEVKPVTVAFVLERLQAARNEIKLYLPHRLKNRRLIMHMAITTGSSIRPRRLCSRKTDSQQ